MSERKARAAGSRAADKVTIEARAAKAVARDRRGRFLPGEGAAAAAKPSARKARARKADKPARWSVKRQRLFLATLAETANVADAARTARISETTVYRKRRESEDFRALWEEALREGIAKLEVMLLHRALYGVTEDIWYGGKKVGRARRFNDRLALSLVTARRGKDRPDDPAEPEPELPIEEIRERFKARVSEMNRRMGGAG